MILSQTVRKEQSVNSLLMRFTLLLTAVVAAGAGAADVPGSADHPELGRYQGAEIVRYQLEDYGQTVFATGPVRTPADADNTAKRVEGRIVRILYQVPKGASPLEVFRNYEARAREHGYELSFSGGPDEIRDYVFKYKHPVEIVGESGMGSPLRYLFASKSADGILQEVSVLVAPHAGGKGTYVALIAAEHTPMAERMVDAKQMQTALQEQGRIALYGIYFDHDGAELLSESSPTLTEIANLMRAHPELKVIVVGHTDNAGGYDYNLSLSKRRAAAVSNALREQHGIDSARLQSAGVGYLAPAASNRTEAGRALNRRVELVEDK